MNNGMFGYPDNPTGEILVPASIRFCRIEVDSPWTKIDIPPLPQGYETARMILTGRSSQTATETAVNAIINGDNSAIYDWIYMGASGSATVLSSCTAADTKGYCAVVSGASAAAQQASSTTIEFPHYSSPNFQKNWSSVGMAKFTNSNSGLSLRQWGGSWRNEDPIRHITLVPGSGNFMPGTILSVYLMS